MQISLPTISTITDYLPQYHEEEQTLAQRWDAVQWAICAGASDWAVSSQDMTHLELRYVACEID